MNTHDNITESFFDEAFMTPRFPGNDVDIREFEDEQEEAAREELDRAQQDAEEAEYEEFTSIDDMSDDAEALASAGHGTDEDYNGGCYGDEG